LLLALGHTRAALVLGGGALLLGCSALRSRTRALARLVRTGARAAFAALAGLCICEGRGSNQRCRSSRDPQCGPHANYSFPLCDSPCVRVCHTQPGVRGFVPEHAAAKRAKNERIFSIIPAFTIEERTRGGAISLSTPSRLRRCAIFLSGLSSTCA